MPGVRIEALHEGRRTADGRLLTDLDGTQPGTHAVRASVRASVHADDVQSVGVVLHALRPRF